MEGWSTAIALSSAALTALSAARSACGLIVVASWLAFGKVTVAWLPGTAWPPESSIWTDSPGVPASVGACPARRLAMWAMPGSL